MITSSWQIISICGKWGINRQMNIQMDCFSNRNELEPRCVILNQKLSLVFSAQFSLCASPNMSYRKQGANGFTNPQHLHFSSCTKPFLAFSCTLSMFFLPLSSLSHPPSPFSYSFINSKIVIESQMIFYGLGTHHWSKQTEILAFMKFTFSFFLCVSLAVLL